MKLVNPVMMNVIFLDEGTPHLPHWDTSSHGMVLVRSRSLVWPHMMPTMVVMMCLWELLMLLLLGATSMAWIGEEFQVARALSREDPQIAWRWIFVEVVVGESLVGSKAF